MGTRSITRILDERQQVICQIYTQFDGYPEGVGVNLAKLCDVTIVNGMTGERKDIANGMSCLAARIVAGLKKEPGNVYLYPPNDKSEEDFNYTITGEVGKTPRIKCESDEEVVFDLPAKDVIRKYGHA